MDDILMEEELFGPILPIVTVDNFDDALSKVHSLEKPLAAYCFGKDNQIYKPFIFIFVKLTTRRSSAAG